MRQPPAPGGFAVSPKADSDPLRLGTASAVTPVVPIPEAHVRGAVIPSGYAVRRPVLEIAIAFPYYGPWGYAYPFYGGGFGGCTMVGYNPWYYGATSWGWGRYGFWYDPAEYFYEPVPETAEIEAVETPLIGTLRLRSNQTKARVYVDGVFVGIVDEFDGLSDHLELERGRHTIELHADGFESAKAEVEIKAGKTQTLRLTMKR